MAERRAKRTAARKQGHSPMILQAVRPGATSIAGVRRPRLRQRDLRSLAGESNRSHTQGRGRPRVLKGAMYETKDGTACSVRRCTATQDKTTNNAQRSCTPNVVAWKARCCCKTTHGAQKQHGKAKRDCTCYAPQGDVSQEGGHTEERPQPETNVNAREHATTKCLDAGDNTGQRKDPQ